MNDKFLVELNGFYGKLKPCTSMQGDKHEFLGMTFKYKKDGTLEVRMESHVEGFIKNCPEINENPGVVTTPAAKNLFNIDGQSESFDSKQKEAFHLCVAKGLFIGKRVRPNIQMPMIVLVQE